MRYKDIIVEDVQAVEDEHEENTRQYDPSKDAFTHQDLDSTRKPSLTLKMVNRLKKIRSTKNLEMAKQQELLGIMYGNSGSEEEL